MTKQVKIIIGVVAVLLVLGIGAFIFFKKSSNQPVATEQIPPANSSTETSNKITGKFWDLANAGKDQQCIFSTNKENLQTSGTIYISGNNIRGDFSSLVNGQNINTSMIKNGDTIYTWTSEAMVGTKMSFENVKTKTPDPSSNTTDQFFQDYEYQCQGWTPDPTKFTPPTNINFIDVTKSMSSPTVPTNTKPNSSVCDQIPDPQAKAACLKAL